MTFTSAAPTRWEPQPRTDAETPGAGVGRSGGGGGRSEGPMLPEANKSLGKTTKWSEWRSTGVTRGAKDNKKKRKEKKELTRLQELSPSMRVNTRYVTPARSISC